MLKCQSNCYIHFHINTGMCFPSTRIFSIFKGYSKIVIRDFVNTYQNLVLKKHTLISIYLK